MKVLILKGLPGSGKSMYAKELSKEHLWKRVNKDDIRNMVNSGVFTGKNERDVVSVRNILVEYWLDKGYNVIVDDTNLNPIHEKYFFDTYKDRHIVEVKVFDTPVDACVSHDLHREHSVGSDVIYSMYNMYCDKREKHVDTHEKAYCIICDIDGTLADSNGRNPFSIDVEKDIVHKHTATLLDWSPYDIILFSGRGENARKNTEHWLEMNNISWDNLYMRSEKDGRKDSIVKQEMYEKYVKDLYHVVFVIDDRPQVIRMWKSLGIPVFNADQRMYHSEF
jgi:predicted kinase